LRAFGLRVRISVSRPQVGARHGRRDAEVPGVGLAVVVMALGLLVTAGHDRGIRELVQAGIRYPL
jgi:hypothetical protein